MTLNQLLIHFLNAGLQKRISMPGISESKNQAQGLVLSRQALYRLSLIPALPVLTLVLFQLELTVLFAKFRITKGKKCPKYAA